MRFIHMADVHLGMEPDKGMRWSGERARERWDALQRVIELCNREQVDLLLSVGDLFHRQPTLSEIREVKYLFSQLERTRVVLLAGNHDHLSTRSRYPELVQEDRVWLLPGDEVASLLIPGCNTTVYGMSYTGRSQREDVLRGVRPLRTRGHHILMAHGGDTGYLPFDRRELAQAGFDYVALGHIHKPEQFGERMAYAGSLEPLDKTETGRHGVILGELADGVCRTEFLPLAAREYRELSVPLRPEWSLRELADRIGEEIRSGGGEHIYQVLLTGYHDPEAACDLSQLAALLADRGRVVDIEDRSQPYYDFQQLQTANRDNLLGQFLERAQQLSGEPAWRERVMAAGVQALLAGRDDG